MARQFSPWFPIPISLFDIFIAFKNFFMNCKPDWEFVHKLLTHFPPQKNEIGDEKLRLRPTFSTS